MRGGDAVDADSLRLTSEAEADGEDRVVPTPRGLVSSSWEAKLLADDGGKK